MSDYRLGTIWLIDFEPQVGSEINALDTSFKSGDAKRPVVLRRSAPIGAAPPNGVSRKTRPGLIISNTKFNLQRQKITVLPLTSRQKKSGGMARIYVPKSKLNGLAQNSEIIAIDPATFDKQRFNRFIGILEADLLKEVQAKLKIYLDL